MYNILYILVVKPINPQVLMRYQTRDGKVPFSIWLKRLDATTQARVEGRILRVEMGLLGDCKAVGEGVIELRLDFGPGYRVYFAYVNGAMVLLLSGGDKTTQKLDIKLARKYLKDYKERTQ